MAEDWERRLAALWATLDQRAEDDFLAEIDRLTAELPAGSAVATFERAAAFDSTGHSDRAVPLYRAALAAGLDGERRRRATIAPPPALPALTGQLRPRTRRTRPRALARRRRSDR